MEYSEAKTMVLEFINERFENGDDELVIVDEDVLEIEVGWVFCYDSKIFLETNQLAFALAGNAPVLFDNRDETLHVTGTAKPLSEYIQDHLSNYKPQST
ncbi:YrhB domain-containing protein [Endozoicomonas arenosclerae]|uniref:YrhB domain-containing protein n=1 Tax=Endozoicomonas arenosclerae TaxID=1633495 RepID=UPI0012946989|nr:YrhB domain-containing protein [Endozoicomonas arenosclerae]